MRAWRVHELGEPSAVLQMEELERPIAGPGQRLLRVLASAANFPDVLMCRGMYQVRPDLPFTPGVEVCGEDVATGERVGAAVQVGGYGEYCVADEAMVFPSPSGLDDAEAACLTIGYQTAWFALHRRTRIQPGEVLLVHAAAGGVGSAAVQLGKAAGATVIGVAGGPKKAEVVRALGADVVVDRTSEDFVAVVNEATGKRGADVVFDPVGGETYQRTTKCIAFEGRIVVIGFAGGDIQSAALNHALVKNYSIIGLHWGLYAQRAPQVMRECHAELTRLVESGAIRPLIGDRLGFEQIPAGLQALADGETTGRVVFTA